MRKSVVFGAGIAAGIAVGFAYGGISGHGVSLRRRRPGRSPYPPFTPAPLLETVHEFLGPIPTGVTVSLDGRIFVCHPRWEDPVLFTVAELVEGREVPFPDAAWNDKQDLERLFSVQSVVVDARNRLWALDTGSRDMGPPDPARAKLVGFDLARGGAATRVIRFGEDVLLPGTYLNDVRFDLARGEDGIAYVTDSALGGPNGIIVVDLASGRSWRRLSGHPATSAEKSFAAVLEGRPVLLRRPGELPRPALMGSDGIAISSRGARLWFCPLAGRSLHSVSLDALSDPSSGDEVVARSLESEERRFASDGLEADTDGRLYLTDWEHNAIQVREPDGSYRTLVSDPRMWWPDTLSLARDGHLYFTANQLHRLPKFHGGKDRREKPMYLFRVQVDALPVLLDRARA